MDWRLFGSTFSLIFVAELPDKTALATLLLATRGNPWAIFIGVALAFVVQTVIAVVTGSVFKALPETWVRLGSGLVFVLFAAMFWKESLKTDSSAEDEGEGESAELRGAGAEGKPFLRQVVGAFTVIFIAEWGDLTQLATISLQAENQKPWTILCAAVLALWAVTALTVSIGNRARHWIRPRLLQRLAAVGFLATGLWLLASWARAH